MLIGLIINAAFGFIDKRSEWNAFLGVEIKLWYSENCFYFWRLTYEFFYKPLYQNSASSGYINLEVYFLTIWSIFFSFFFFLFFPVFLFPLFRSVNTKIFRASPCTYVWHCWWQTHLGKVACIDYHLGVPFCTKNKK